MIQLWANSAKTIAIRAQGTELVRSKINFLGATISWKNVQKFLQNHLFFLKIYTMKFWLIWARSELIKCQNSLLSLIILDTFVPEYICMSLKRMKWHVVCVASARPALHGQSIIRKTYVNSYIFSQKSSWRKCRHIFWVVWKGLNSLKEAIPL